MNAKLCRLAATVALMASLHPAWPRAPTIPAPRRLGRGAGARRQPPADGAIKGGAIVPGETGGMPDRAASRCSDLTGTLREQCLARNAMPGAGATRLPEVDAAKPPPAREAPPPQNPGSFVTEGTGGETRWEAATGTLTPARYRARSAVEHSVVVDRTLAQGRPHPEGLSLINRYSAAPRRCR